MKEQLLRTPQTEVVLGSVEFNVKEFNDKENTVYVTSYIIQLFRINQSRISMVTNEACVVLNIQQTLDI